MKQGASLVKEHASPKSTISVEQQSWASRPMDAPMVLQPSPPHMPHSATQHALPLEDWIPVMSFAPAHTRSVGAFGVYFSRICKNKESKFFGFNDWIQLWGEPKKKRETKQPRKRMRENRTRRAAIKKQKKKG